LSCKKLHLNQEGQDDYDAHRAGRDRRQRRGCVAKKPGENQQIEACSFLFSLGCYSKQAADESHLTHTVSLAHSSHLSLANHVDRLVSFYSSLCGLQRKEAHHWFGQALDEAMILFDTVVQILHWSSCTVLGKKSIRFQFAKRFWRGSVFVHVDYPQLTALSDDQCARHDITGLKGAMRAPDEFAYPSSLPIPDRWGAAGSR
jgi:hypothetical protein